MFWTLDEPSQMPLKCTAKFRYRQADIPVTVYDMGNSRVKIIFDSPVKAVTPGQVAVLYDGEICLGSAIINSAEPVDPKYRFLYESANVAEGIIKDA